MDVLIALSSCSVFSGFSRQDLQTFAEVSRTITCERGEQVFAEGDPARDFYAVVTGKVKLYRLSPEGKVHIVRFMSRGDLFAEAAAFCEGTYPVFAEAVMRSNLLSFEAKPFLDLVSSDPRLARQVIVALSQRLETVVGILGQLALSDLTARLAKYILGLSLKAQRSRLDGSLVRLDIRKSDLAARLGTVSETLSRSLARLRKDRVIEVKGNEIHILDAAALSKLAAGLGE